MSRSRSDASRARPSAAAAAIALAIAATSGGADASSGLDSPEGGVAQIGRGGAWVARADDPLAAYVNPAGLAAQPSGAHLGVHLMLLNRCFTRLGPDGSPVPPSVTTPLPAPGSAGGPNPTVCATSEIFPNPQLAVALRLGDTVAAGFAVLGPHGVGSQRWPESIPYTHPSIGPTTQPSPQRYILVSNDALILLPTLSLAITPTPGLSLGAGLVWGVATIDFVSFAQATSSQQSDDFNAHKDLRSRVQASDLFVPGFVLGGRWSATSRLDVGAWFKWQDAVRSTTDLTIASRYWTTAGIENPDPCGEGEALDCNITHEEGAGDLTLRIPMEAKLGLRYHHPRGPARRPAWAPPAPHGARDAMSEDLFDVEIDFTWANNSALEGIEVRFHEGIPVRGTEVGFVPTNADVPHRWKDVLGVRLGGDYVALPSLLAFRAGGFFEKKGQDDADLNLDFHLGWRLGLGLGTTVRVGPVDLTAAFQRTFFGALDNGGKGRVNAISGSKASGYRSVQHVNGGRLESSLNEFGLGGTMRF